jgi:hypothetical protein
MKEPQDHRIRVAEERRNETQEKLLLSGLILGSEKPAKEISIEEIYSLAETSRGTFYKYFTGTSNLFKVLGLNVANQVVDFLAPLKPSFADPAIALASMTRIGIRLAVNIPMLGKFMSDLLFTTLYEKVKGNITLCLDSDAWENSLSLYHTLNGGVLYNRVKLIKLPGDSDIADLRGEIKDEYYYEIK